MLFSAATMNNQVLGTTAQATPVAPIVETATTSTTTSIVLSTDSTINQPLTLEQYVRNYYKGTPILAEISKCESRFHQFSNTGDVIHGKVDPDDIGIMQINEHYNGDLAKKLGFDIYTLDGNLAFGKWMYDHEGTQPWASSEPCWGN